MQYANQYEKEQWKNLRKQIKYIYSGQDLFVSAACGVILGIIIGLAVGVAV